MKVRPRIIGKYGVNRLKGERSCKCRETEKGKGI
jgi:hypothetical protein